MKKNYKLIALLAFAVFGLFAFRPGGPGGRYFEVAKNLEIFTNVFNLALRFGMQIDYDDSSILRDPT